jgi:hypothetical protein
MKELMLPYVELVKPRSEQDALARHTFKLFDFRI